jgi:hypothetical protein
MKRWGRLATCLLALATVRCGDSPTTPTATALIVPTSMVIARNGSATVTAQLQKSNGVTEDVTATAAWVSSAPGVMTAQAGVLKAVGIGTATVTVTQSGLSATIAVTARRNTRLTGVIGIMETGNIFSIHGVEVWLDTRQIYALGASGAERTWSVDLSAQNYDKSVAPGTTRLSVRVLPDPDRPPLESNFASRIDSYVEVLDSDTNERLERIPLSVQSVVKPAGSRDSVSLVWTLSIGTYQ